MSQSYHRIIRKVVIAFGNIFNNINISRYDAQGVEKEHFLVPIVYGGKEKYVSRLEGDPTLDKKVQITLPIMSFEMKDMKYDAKRKLMTNMKTLSPNSSTAVYNPVPFDFDFTLYAYVRNIEDGAQLMEKILPHFTPDYTVNVNLIPEMGVVKQLPIVLNEVTSETEYEGDYNSKVRSIVWTLNFTVKGYLYGPSTDARVIRSSFTNIYDDKTLLNRQVELTMSTGGSGQFKTDEFIYQGYSLDTASASAKVRSWNSTTKKMVIYDSTGHFVTGETVTGSSTHAKWTLNAFDFVNTNLVEVVVTPNPSGVVLPNNYTYTVTTTEYPDI